MNTYPNTVFSPEDIAGTQPALKIGILATVTPGGLPHVTMLSSLMACASQQMCFGQFTEGYSKQHLTENPHAAFLVMGLDKHLWRGTISYTHSRKEGPEYDTYNNVPMFRYNAYFGVHTVHYFALLAHSGKAALPMNRVIFASVQSMVARLLGKKPGGVYALNEWTVAFLNKLDTLKFLAYVGADGYPQIIPAIQAQCLDASHVLFSTSVYTDELQAIPAGAQLCVFGLALTMEDVLLRGTYLGLQRVAGVRVGVLQVEWVYNPMPPVPGQVFPEVELKPVREF